MTYNGWTNDHTWGVAGACDNTESFADQLADIVKTARLGMVIAAAHTLEAVVRNEKVLGSNLPSWVDLDAVNWTELVEGWASDAA